MHIFKRLAGATPISLHMLGRYAEEVEADPEVPVGDLVRTIYAEIHQEYLEDGELIAVCERLQAHGQKTAENAAKGQQATTPAVSRAKPKQFSDFYNEFMMKLDISQSLLWLTEFDVQEARRLYLYEDFEIVEAMLDTKRGLEAERNRLHYEASLFGYGGGYASGGKSTRDEGEVKVHDLSGLSQQDMLARISAAGQRR